MCSLIPGVSSLVMYLKCCLPHVCLSGLECQVVLCVSPASHVLPLVCLLKTVDCENSHVSLRSLLLRSNAVADRDYYIILYYIMNLISFRFRRNN